MDIPYSTRSQFFKPVEQALREAGGRVERPIGVSLRPGGYSRDVNIVIRPDDTVTFWAEWTSTQPSRFSARIRAAATVLQRFGLTGRFRITHEDGTLIIRPS
jgi:hypothetical protein